MVHVSLFSKHGTQNVLLWPHVQMDPQPPVIISLHILIRSNASVPFIESTRTFAHLRNPLRQIIHRQHSFSDWKFDKGAEYFPKPPASKFKRKSGPEVILDVREDDDAPFESPYAKIRRQKHPSFSNGGRSINTAPPTPTASTASHQHTDSNPDPFASLQPLLPNPSKEGSKSSGHGGDVDDAGGSLMAQREHESNALTRWREWKLRQTKTKEYIPRSDLDTPRSLEDLKNWNIKQEEAAQFKRAQHIIQTMQPPDPLKERTVSGGLMSTENGDASLALSERHKFDFSGEATYVFGGNEAV